MAEQIGAWRAAAFRATNRSTEVWCSACQVAPRRARTGQLFPGQAPLGMTIVALVPHQPGNRKHNPQKGGQSRHRGAYHLITGLAPSTLASAVLLGLALKVCHRRDCHLGVSSDHISNRGSGPKKIGIWQLEKPQEMREKVAVLQATRKDPRPEPWRSAAAKTRNRTQFWHRS